MNKKGRPTGWNDFDALVRKLVQVPKEEVERELAKKRKPARRKKKK